MVFNRVKTAHMISPISHKEEKTQKRLISAVERHTQYNFEDSRNNRYFIRNLNLKQ